MDCIVPVGGKNFRRRFLSSLLWAGEYCLKFGRNLRFHAGETVVVSGQGPIGMHSWRVVAQRTGAGLITNSDCIRRGINRSQVFGLAKRAGCR